MLVAVFTHRYDRCFLFGHTIHSIRDRILVSSLSIRVRFRVMCASTTQRLIQCLGVGFLSETACRNSTRRIPDGQASLLKQQSEASNETPRTHAEQ